MNCNKMTCFRLYKYAKETREAQKKYFRTRSRDDLRTSKALERELDKAIEAYHRVVLGLDPAQPDPVWLAPVQPNLFGEEVSHA